MRYVLAIATAALVLGTGACNGDLNSPTSLRRIQMNARTPSVQFNADEQKMIEDFLRQFPQDKAARLREKFARNDVTVMAPDAASQKQISAIYEARANRIRSEMARGQYVPRPRTAENSWVPDAKEELLIRAFLSRIPEEHRDEARNILLRTDAMVNVQRRDPDGQKILNQIYEMRRIRLENEERDRWKK